MTELSNRWGRASGGDLPPGGHLHLPQEGHWLARQDALQARKKMRASP
jgi:hypothetical protein